VGEKSCEFGFRVKEHYFSIMYKNFWSMAAALLFLILEYARELKMNIRKGEHPVCVT
jgi:hypothetical protein